MAKPRFEPRLSEFRLCILFFYAVKWFKLYPLCTRESSKASEQCGVMSHKDWDVQEVLSRQGLEARKLVSLLKWSR